MYINIENMKISLQFANNVKHIFSHTKWKLEDRYYQQHWLVSNNSDYAMNEEKKTTINVV